MSYEVYTERFAIPCMQVYALLTACVFAYVLGFVSCLYFGQVFRQGRKKEDSIPHSYGC